MEKDIEKFIEVLGEKMDDRFYELREYWRLTESEIKEIDNFDWEWKLEFNREKSKLELIIIVEYKLKYENGVKLFKKSSYISDYEIDDIVGNCLYDLDNAIDNAEMTEDDSDNYDEDEVRMNE